MPTAATLTKRGFARVAGGDDSRFSLWTKELRRVVLDAETGAVSQSETLSPEESYLWILELSAIVRDLAERSASLMTPAQRRALRDRLQVIPRPKRARSIQ